MEIECGILAGPSVRTRVRTSDHLGFKCTQSTNPNKFVLVDLLGEPDNPCPESSGIKIIEPRSPSAVGALLPWSGFSRSNSLPLCLGAAWFRWLPVHMSSLE